MKSFLPFLRRNAPATPDDAVALNFIPKTDRTRLPRAGESIPPKLPSSFVRSWTQYHSQPRLQGWKAGAVSSASVAAIALIINITVVVWLSRHPNEDGTLVELFRGSCDRVESMHIWSHLLINAIGTLLLSGSNYCMQVLAAPTRNEIDHAHAQKRWLDIGVPSVRNIWRIAPHRAVIWWALGLSSIPLHLLYNSAFYASIGVANYRIDFVTPEFRDGTVQISSSAFRGVAPPAGRLDQIAQDPCPNDAECRRNVTDHLNYLLANENSRLEKLSTEQCISAYGHALLTERSNLIVVTSNASEQGIVQADYLYSFGNVVNMQWALYSVFDWMCYSSDRMVPHFDQLALPPGERGVCESWIASVAADASEWTPMDFDIDSCLSEIIEERCSFSGNISILTIVIVCNIVKIACMLFVAFGLNEHTPLITIGDAISSFLERPDATTLGKCLWARTDVTAQFGPSIFESSVPRVAKRQQRRWKQAASRKRWFWTLFLLGLAIIVALALFGAGYSQILRHKTPMSALGFGKLNASALVNGWGIVQMSDSRKQILSAILIANLPQTILSFLYLNLNSLVTSLWLSVEWLSYATTRKPLRVSKPSGDQRMTFFLQLPYHVGIPLMVLSGTLHWLVSQSFFLAVVAEYDWDGTLIDPTSIATCGYSLLPMLIVVGIGVGLIVGLVWLGWLCRLDGTGELSGMMPLAGSCSAAISAACHGALSEQSAEARLLVWGALDRRACSQQDGGDLVGHCGFSSGPVEEVVEGQKYA